MDFFTFDDDYVRRLREGDPDTVKHYYGYFTPLLKATLRGRVSPSDIDDAAQDVHKHVLTNLKNGKAIEKLGPYVFGICNNVRKEYQRRDGRTEPIVRDFPSRDNPEDDLLNKESAEHALRALHRLAKHHPRDAEILDLVFLQEMERNVICRKLDITRANLRVLLCRALKKFHEEYDDPDDS
jgi:RNA polymerase sigma factor (sigma-70 family)